VLLAGAASLALNLALLAPAVRRPIPTTSSWADLCIRPHWRFRPNWNPRSPLRSPPWRSCWWRCFS